MENVTLAFMFVMPTLNMMKVVYFILSVFTILQITDLIGCQNHATGSCEQNTVELSNLLSYACTRADDTGDCRRNFLQAVRRNNNQPSISLLSLYADAYFTDTQYNECVDIIDIAQCYSEASIDNPAEEPEDQIMLYKNITSCVLATARCSSTNPITGQRQTNSFTITSYNRFGKPIYKSVPLYNALQVNQAGDLRVIALPGITTIQRYMCPYEFNLRESSWLEYNC